MIIMRIHVRTYIGCVYKRKNQPQGQVGSRQTTDGWMDGCKGGRADRKTDQSVDG